MYAAVDIGGTKTLVAAFSKEGKVRQEEKFSTPENYDDFIKKLEDVAVKFSTKDFRAAVVGAPGKIDRKHGVGLVFGNLPWKNVTLEQDIEKIFNCPVTVENDTNLAGLSEAVLVKGKFHKVLYVTISTGIRGAYIIDGEMDPDTIDEEVGHMSLEHKGKFEKWEEFASGKAIVNKYGKPASDIKDVSVWKSISRDIAAGFITLIATLTPEIIIVGGGVGSHFEKFDKYLEKELSRMNNPLLSTPVIRKAKHPEEAVIYGCYQLAKDTYERAS